MSKKRTKFKSVSKLFLTIAVFLFWLLSLMPAVAKPQNNSVTAPETVLLKMPPAKTAAHQLKIVGLAKTLPQELAVTFFNSDGLSWSGSQWQAEAKWFNSKIKPLSSVTWQASVKLPQANNRIITVLLKTVGANGSTDPTPLTFKLQLDNQPPTVVNVSLEPSGDYVNKNKVTVVSEVQEATRLKIAASKSSLKKAKWQKFTNRTNYNLAAGDGLKNIWLAYADAFGNEVQKNISVYLDTASPVVNKLTPGDKNTAIDVNAPLKVEFIEASGLDTTSINSEDPFFYLLDAKGQRVPATLTYYPGSKTVVLKPEQPLAEDQIYTAFLTSKLKDLAGNSLENSLSWSFKAVTSSAPETNLLTLLKPTLSGSSVVLEGYASHSEGVKKVLVSLQNQAGQFWQSQTSTWTTEPVEQEINFKAVKKVNFFHQKLALPPLDNEAVNLKIAAVNRYAAVDPTPVQKSVIIDNQPPLVGTLALASGQKVTATRNITVQLEEVKKADFVRFAESPQELTSKPYQPFTSPVNFALSPKQGIKTVYFQFKDKAGNETKVSRKTVLKVYYDKAGPKIRATFPEKNATNVNTSTMLTVNFDDLALDAQTVNEKTFTLVEAATSESVPAQVKFDTVSRMATLMPLKDLSYGTKYVAKVSAEIKDLVGNSLGKDFVWQFQTVGVSTHPPAAPKKVKVVAGDKANQISWEAVSPEKDKGGDFNPPIQGGYNIYRALSADGPYEQINSVPVTTTFFEDDDFDRPAIYFYLVKAIDAGGQESLETKPQANELVSLTKKVKAESSATVTAANGLVELTLPKVGWQRRLSLKVLPLNEVQKQNNFTSYELPFLGEVYELTSDRALGAAKLKLKLAGNGENAKLAKFSSSGWQLLTEGKYEYDSLNQFLYYESLTEGGLLALVKQEDQTPPPVPVRLESKVENGQVLLNWRRVFDFDSGLSGYNLTKVAVSEATSTATQIKLETETVQLPATANKFVDVNVKAGGQYLYTLTAVNGSGQESSPTQTSVKLPLNLTYKHRPTIKVTWRCLDCHLTKGRLNKKILTCFTCHDGSGSKLIIQGYPAKAPYYCQGCHRLSKKDLQKQKVKVVADSSSTANLCLNCHQQKLKKMLETAATEGHQDCRSCHSLHRPGGKQNLFLVNPLNTLKNWRENETNFCLQCHQAPAFWLPLDVPGKFRPKPITFPNSSKWPFFSGWDKRLFKRSAHASFISCLSCHRVHTNTSNLLVFKQGNKYIKLPLGTESEFICYQCHKPNGWPKAKDILSLQTKASGHLNQAFNLHSSKEETSSLTLNRHASCADCHNVHSLTKEKRLPFSNKVSGALKGVGGVDVTLEAPGVMPLAFPVKSARYEYQICFKCHTWTKEGQLSEVVLAFNRGNSSFHPVLTRGKNRKIKRETFVNGWSYLATMYCSDCHSNDSTTQAQGPHSSSYKYLLKLPYGAEASGTASEELCFSCHKRQVYQQGETGSNFNASQKSGHQLHAQKQVKCYQCHETHGSVFQPHLIKIVNTTETSGIIGFTHDETGGSCLTSCHGVRLYNHR